MALAALSEALDPYYGQVINIDCSNLMWLDAHLSAPLRTILLRSEGRGNTVHLKKLKPNIQEILSKNGLLAVRIRDTYNTTMPLREFGLNNSVEFVQYAKKNLSRKEMPKMTEQLQRKFHEGIDELYANSSLHSQSTVGIVAAGQVYPKKHLLTISISDGGHGIIGSLTNAGIPIRNHAIAIDWAMQKDNTTRTGDIPGGLGLSVLRNFISMNGGKLIVISKKGFWCQDGANIQKHNLQHEFPGTCVIVEINTADTKSYDLKSHVSADKIW